MKFLIVLLLINIYNTQASNKVITIDIIDVSASYEDGRLPNITDNNTNDDKTETDNLKLVLELARRMAPVGVHELPPFDPYSGSDNSIVQLKTDTLNGTVDLSNVVVKGLSAYKFDNVSVQSSQAGKLIQYVLSIPSVSIEGKGKMSMSVGGGKPVVQSGDVSGVITDVTATVALGIVPRLLGPGPLENSYMVSGIEVASTIGELKVQATNVKSIAERSRIISPTPDKDDVADAVIAAASQIAVEQLNKILLGMTVNQVEDFLLPKPQPLTWA